ncbi:hypothetical protein SLA2020_151460 [Shorea laevis]
MELAEKIDVTVNELLQAQAHVWNHTYCFIKSMSLKCAVQLGIPDVIHNYGKPMTVTELAKALPIHPEKVQHLYRFMRILVTSGFFSEEEVPGNGHEKGYVPTDASRFLLKDNPFNASSMVLLLLDPVFKKPWHHLSSWFQNDDPTPFFTAHGSKFWDFTAIEPQTNSLIYEGMSTDGLLAATVVLDKCREVFDGVRTIVDVGGGTGNITKVFAKAFPDIQFTVFDQPPAVSGSEDSGNMKFVGGNMFEAIPPADAAMIKWVMIDWDDDSCVKILKRCKEAIKKKVMIIEMVMENQTVEENIETQIFSDLEAMVIAQGKERKEEEWAKLFFEAGFRNYKIYPVLGLRCLIEIYP